MRSTKIVTSFIRDKEKLLILKRSDKVKSMKGLWAGVSGIIENDEEPLSLEQKLKFLKRLELQKTKLH